MPEDGKAFGRRVAFYRKRRGWSQTELAALLDRSETWVSQVERGVRRIDRMSVLERLAEQLGVPLAELAPEVPVVSASAQRPAASSTLSLALASSDALEAVLASPGPVDVDRLGAEAVQAWQYAHGSRYDELAAQLTGLIPDLERAVRVTGGADRRRVCVARAKVYHAAAAVLAKLGEVGPAWVAVDRAISSAEQADDPLLMAEGAFRLAIVFQGARRFDLVARTAQTAAQALDGLVDAGELEAVALRGALSLQLAVAAARTNDGDAAYAHLDQARQAATTLGVDRNDYDTEFGPTNVLLHEVAVAVELGDAGHALRAAAKADPSRLSPERHARLLIDVARAHAQRRQVDQVIDALNRAAEVAPQQVQTHALVRGLMADLLRGDHADHPDLRSLAKQLNIDT
jgi:transcriptional regulator with XRE-family HTH domain